jgi:hypothetical protein
MGRSAAPWCRRVWTGEDGVLPPELPRRPKTRLSRLRWGPLPAAGGEYDGDVCSFCSGRLPQSCASLPVICRGAGRLVTHGSRRRRRRSRPLDRAAALRRGSRRRRPARRRRPCGASPASTSGSVRRLRAASRSPAPLTPDRPAYSGSVRRPRPKPSGSIAASPLAPCLCRDDLEAPLRKQFDAAGRRLRAVRGDAGSPGRLRPCPVRSASPRTPWWRSSARSPWPSTTSRTCTPTPLRQSTATPPSSWRSTGPARPTSASPWRRSSTGSCASRTPTSACSSGCSSTRRT